MNPNYTLARLWYSLLLLRQERFEEALEQTELGLAIDPFDPLLSSTNAAVLANLGRHEEAIGRLRRFLELEPNARGVRRTLARIYVRLDRHEEAMKEFDRAGSADGVERVRAFQGHTADLRRILGELHETAQRQYVSPITFASVYATLGDKEQALAYLTLAADTKAIGLVDVVTAAKFTPCFSSPTMGKEFDFLRSDPRFVQLRRRMKVE